MELDIIFIWKIIALGLIYFYLHINHSDGCVFYKNYDVYTFFYSLFLIIYNIGTSLDSFFYIEASLEHINWLCFYSYAHHSMLIVF